MRQAKVLLQRIQPALDQVVVYVTATQSVPSVSSFNLCPISLRQIREVRPQLLLIRLLPRGRAQPPRRILMAYCVARNEFPVQQLLGRRAPIDKRAEPIRWRYWWLDAQLLKWSTN